MQGIFFLWLVDSACSFQSEPVEFILDFKIESTLHYSTSNLSLSLQ